MELHAINDCLPLPFAATRPLPSSFGEALPEKIIAIQPKRIVCLILIPRM
jgi:hypothetical protein